MEIEIDLNMALTPVFAQKIQKSLAGKFELISLKAVDKFSLRPVGMIDANLTIDQAIADYLESVKPIGPALAQLSGVLRVGVFFSSDEAAAFSVDLSTATIQTLATYQLAIDVTCYPCS
ncbi:MAG: hypothetical protein KF686_13315 [Ramlibacter sp.]|nr:hypothetical protein [Ramlibacter sp.]